MSNAGDCSRFVFFYFCSILIQMSFEFLGLFFFFNKEAIDELRGAVTIVYPMGLPPYDPILMEFENNEDLEGTQVTVN